LPGKVILTEHLLQLLLAR